MILSQMALSQVTIYRPFEQKNSTYLQPPKKNDKTINVGNVEKSIKRASDMSPFPLVPRGPLGPLIFPSC